MGNKSRKGKEFGRFKNTGNKIHNNYRLLVVYIHVASECTQYKDDVPFNTALLALNSHRSK